MNVCSLLKIFVRHIWCHTLPNWLITIKSQPWSYLIISWHVKGYWYCSTSPRTDPHIDFLYAWLYILASWRGYVLAESGTVNDLLGNLRSNEQQLNGRIALFQLYKTLRSHSSFKVTFLTCTTACLRSCNIFLGHNFRVHSISVQKSVCILTKWWVLFLFGISPNSVVPKVGYTAPGSSGIT